MEVYFHGDLSGHWVTVFHAGLESPVLDRFDGFFIKPHAEASKHFDIRRAPIHSDDHTQCANALILRLPCFFGKFRIGLVDWPWRRHSATNTKYPAAGSATFARPETRPVA